MKRYGDNLPSSSLEESEDKREKTKYIAGNCAVRQDMVSFLVPTADTPNKRKGWNLFSLFRFGQKKTKEHGV
jgi:hypothetical protein